MLKINLGKKLRIAVILSGHYRNGAVTRFLSKTQHEVDVYAHSWDDVGHKNKSVSSQRIAVAQKLSNVPHMRDFVVENNHQFLDKIRPETKARRYYSIKSIEPLLKSQLYSTKIAFKLFQASRRKIDYDLVVRCRFDIDVVHFGITQKCMEFVKKGAIFVSSENLGHHKVFCTGCILCDRMYDFGVWQPHPLDHVSHINDRFAYGGEPVMAHYFCMYDHFDAINDQFNEMNDATARKLGVVLPREGKNTMVYDNDLASFVFFSSSPERVLLRHLRGITTITSRDARVELDRSVTD